jgi:hypothetical protein
VHVRELDLDDVPELRKIWSLKDGVHRVRARVPDVVNGDRPSHDDLVSLFRMDGGAALAEWAMKMERHGQICDVERPARSRALSSRLSRISVEF